MENRKMNLDREKLNSDQIQAKQNFNEVLSNFKLLKKPFYKTKWFWGATGFATLGVAVVLGLSNLNNNSAYAKNDTLNKTSQQTASAANQLPEDTDCIHPIIENAIPFEKHIVFANKDNELTLKDGSIIKLPKGSLVAKDVNEPVNIETRTFHNKTEAFLAGVPMDVEQGAFESAGMIEIRGSQNGVPISINPIKPIEVELALHKSSKTFNFYYLDEEKKAWEDSPCIYSDEQKNQNSEISVATKIEVKKSEIKEINTELLKVEDQIVSIKSPKKIDYKLPEDQNRIFDLDYSPEEYPELSKLKNVEFEALPNQKNFKTILSSTWSEMDLSSSGKERYTLTFKNSKAKEVIKVRPVLIGSEKQTATELFNAVKEDIATQKADLLEIKRKYKAQEELKRKELAKLVQAFENATGLVMNENQSLQPGNTRNLIQNATASFTTTRFGVFNSDKPIKYPSPMPYTLAFEEGKSKFLARNVYVFDGKKDVRYTYGIGNKPLSQIGLNKGEQVLIAVSASNKVAYTKINKVELKGSNYQVLALTLIEQKDLNGDFIKKILGEEKEVELAQF